MTFFYDLNKKLADIGAKQQLNEDTQVNEKYMGFSKLEREIARRGDVRDPGAVAASIGRKKYGKEKFQKAAAAGRKLGEQDDIRSPRNPQALDYQQGPEDDEEYRRHHGLDDPDRKRERRLRATDHKTLDRLERQAVNRAKQMDEQDIDEVSRGEYIQQQDTKAERTGKDKFKAFGQTFDTDEVDEGRNDPSPLDDPLTRFRKKHAPSVMKDPKGREEVSKLDTEYGERKKTAYGRGEDEEDEDDDDGKKKAKPTGEKRGRGRPKGTRRAIGAKGPTGRSKLMTREGERELNIPGTAGKSEQERHEAIMKKYPGAKKTGKTPGVYTLPDGNKLIANIGGVRRLSDSIGEDYDRDEYDEEGEMAQSQARTIEDAAEELQAILDSDENLPEWVQKKITLAMDYIDTARDYLAANRPEQEMEESALQAHIGKKKYGDSGMKALQKAGREGASKDKMARIRAQHDKLDEVDLEEKAVSKAQRRAAGIAHAAKKGEIPKSELRGASKEMAKMPGGELKKFAKTKEKNLPAKKTEEVEETTTAGNVATGGDAPAKGNKKGGMQFGKGIYDSMNRELEAMIAESMNVSVNMNSEGPNGATKSVTVTATDEDADMLASLLTRSGLGGGMRDDHACSTCGKTPCGCAEQVDENEPDYPTEPVMSDDALQYAGGLNKPKSTGQTTTPIIANQDEREVAYDDDGDALRRMREMAGIQEERKGKPDFLDMDKDGDKDEPMKKAVKDKEEKVDESVERGLWSLWQRIQ